MMTTFEALADPTRRQILNSLRERPRLVGELVDLLQMSQPGISKHLRVLRRARLVQEQREGRQRIYQLSAAPLGDVGEWVESYRRFWEVNLQSLKRHLEGDGS